MNVEEVVDALDISSGAECQCLEIPGIHGVVTVFMGVDVLSKLNEAVFVELNGLDVNHGSRAKCSRDAVFGREAVETERHGINKLVHEATWDAAIYSNQFCAH